MFGLSLLFFLLALVAGILGFGGLAGTLTSLAVIAFYVFVALLIISLIAQAFQDAAGRNSIVGAVALILIVVGGVYLWSHNRSVDRDLAGASADAADIFKKTDAGAKKVVSDVSRGAQEAAHDHDSDKE